MPDIMKNTIRLRNERKGWNLNVAQKTNKQNKQTSIATGPLVSMARPMNRPASAAICSFLPSVYRCRLVSLENWNMPRKINRLKSGSIMPDLK
jgi:hypothetical protein